MTGTTTGFADWLGELFQLVGGRLELSCKKKPGASGCQEMIAFRLEETMLNVGPETFTLKLASGAKGPPAKTVSMA